ncbi:uncharacterized protein LOC115445140 [Manduca sexta]|uniref:Uncharacterized protein n=1 Tax=Manduca sexta TaxID=7130 RepID=A0A921Z7A5_MANSE|nr:uncharacterized protein LOC115445140 [Manduca sexta]KAG6452653.1 hypothetical protein O3G_MSEX007723 [Manduca sexta]
MKLLFATIYAALCVVLVTAIHLGPMKSAVKIGIVGPSTDTPTDVEVRAANNVIGLLEYARRLMPVGIDDFIEVTEPYTKDVLPPLILEFQNGPVEGTVDLMNLVASGTQNFTIHELGVVIDSKRLEFNIGVPEVVVDVDFEGINLQLEQIITFNTSGSSHIVLTGLNVNGAFSVASDDDNLTSNYHVTGLQVTNSAEDVEVNVANEIPEDIVVEVKDALMKSIAKAAINAITEILSHFTLEQVNLFLEI